MTGHRRVFPSQVLSMKKSESINIKLGEELENTETTYTTRFFINMQRIIKLIITKSRKKVQNNDEDIK